MWVAQRGRMAGEIAPWQKRRADKVTNANWVIRSAASDWVGLPYHPWPGVKVEDLAEFAGWYISEGSTHGRQVALAQKASVHPEHYERLVELVTRLGFHPSRSPFSVRICDKEFAHWVEQEFGTGCDHKRIPDWAKEWPRDLLETMLRAAIDGDGQWMSSTLGRINYHV